uniref:Uncharacterized protein n=1 Tax=Arundo donax TaxID=35708 RepID=A0A0A8YSM7_ARUDO
MNCACHLRRARGGVYLDWE